MAESSETKSKNNSTGVGLNTRRQFLKKAGVAAGAAVALYAVPTVTTITSRPAYASLTGPKIPKLQPTNGTIVRPAQPMVFQWEVVEGASTYQLDFWRGRTCDGSVIPTAGRVTRNFLSIRAPTVLGDISWSVTAYDSSGNLINKSDCCWFKVSPTGT